MLAGWEGEGRNKSHLFHHVSTDEVYGTLAHDEAPFTEKPLTRPTHPMPRARRRQTT